MVFPPAPHGDEALASQLRSRLAALDSGVLEWEPLSADGLPESWAGVAAPRLCSERPWAFDVVLPDVAQRLVGHQLVVAVPHDVVVFSVTRPGLAHSLSLHVPFDNAGGEVFVPRAALPEPPWELSAQSAWSRDGIAAAVWEWVAAAGRPDVVPDGAQAPPEDRYQVDENLWATSGAFDDMLGLDPDDAAMITEVFAALAAEFGSAPPG